jgi:hypothetical protein
MNRNQELEKRFKEAFHVTNATKLSRMNNLAAAIVAEWSATASIHGDMKSTLAMYKYSIQIREVTETSCTVELPGKDKEDEKPNVAIMARMLEFGMGPGGIGTSGPYDVRNFLKSWQFDRKRGHNFVNVPFKYSTKMVKEMSKISSGGIGINKTMDKIKSMEVSRVSQEGRWSGGMLSAGHTRRIFNPHTKLAHVTDRMAGLRHMQSQKHNNEHARFITFRRATDTQSSDKWIHPGIKARHLAKMVQNKVPEIWREIT